MTYLDALSYLGDARRFGMKPGLDSMRRLAAAMGDPQEKLRFIHLAGTNGKGSTAAFCEGCLRASGYRVGLYTSPHLVSIRERIQTDRRLIGEEDFAEGMQAVRVALDGMGNPEVTFFEMMTALALWNFARERVDWVVWETGLGGRLDATNIVKPEICIVTNIGLDHQQYLGESLREIAEEKAGIIKPGVPVISAVEKGEAADVILDQIERQACPATLIQGKAGPRAVHLQNGKQGARLWFGGQEHEFEVGLRGAHQVENAACAVAAMEYLRGESALLFEPARQREITVATIARGLRKTVWPGRFEIVSEKPLIVLDGAHNSAGMKSLIQTWRDFLACQFGWSPDQIAHRSHLVLASVADKDITGMAELLRPVVSEVSLVRLANERSAEPSRLASAFIEVPCRCYDSVEALWRELAHAPVETPILVTGSLFLIGEILARREGHSEEYRLNERLEKVTALR